MAWRTTGSGFWSGMMLCLVGVLVAVGPAAGGVPEVVAMQGRRGLSPMDITAVLARVVQDLRVQLEVQQDRADRQEKRIEDLESRLADYEGRQEDARRAD